MASQILHQALDILNFWYTNLRTNLYNTYANTSLINFIRLIAIVGAYLLLRPYLIKLGMRAQRREHEAAETTDDIIPAKLSANSIRGAVEIPEDSDEEEGKGEGGVNWGKKARKRQRQVVKRLLEVEEKRLREEEEEEEDRELEEFLIRQGATGKEVVL